MFTGKLHPYQHEAVLSILEHRSLLVAYAMGTGKTVLTIAAVEEMLGMGEIETCLILVPASVKWQWAKAIAQFTDMPTRTVTLRGTEVTVPDEDSCVVINGTKAKRHQQWARIAAGECSPDYIIASYGSILHDWRDLCRCSIDAMVLDEATVIKNFSAQTTRRIKKLLPPTRIALTGTPVENRPEEVFSIMEWVEESVLGRWDTFDKSFIVRNRWGVVVRYRNLHLLHDRLCTRMVRKARQDPDVAPYLPAVAETTRTVPLDTVGRRIYRRIQRDLLAALDELADGTHTLDLAAYYSGTETAENAAHGRVTARVLAARLLLDHPQLLMDSAEAWHEGLGTGSRYIAEFIASDPDAADHLGTPKLDELVRQVDAMLASDPDAKVAVFSDFRRMLPYLAERLDRFGPLAQYHGGLNADQKAAVKEKFSSDPDCRIFLSTNAGGIGLDLPEVQYLINYDLPDSGGVLAQRNSRHVRASSTHTHVYVVNLIVEDTLEERRQATLQMRGRLADAIVDRAGETVVRNDVASLTAHLEKNITRE